MFAMDGFEQRRLIVCVLVPDFELAALVGGRERLLEGPLAVAPSDPSRQGVGAVSPPARARGVKPGTKLVEALARCPELRLVPPDPERVGALWGASLDTLERLGAQVESDLPGLAFFAADGLLRLHDGRLERLLATVRKELRGTVGDVGTVRFGVAPARFVAWTAAMLAPARRDRERRELIAGKLLGTAAAGAVGASPLPATLVVPPASCARFLASQPVSLLALRPELQTTAALLEQLGIATLGDLAALPRAALAERFGPEGLLAYELARGRDTALLPRRPPERIAESLELPEPGCRFQLERALTMLVERILARGERRGRSLRVLVLSALLTSGGSWRVRIVPRRPTADSELLCTLLAQSLESLPSPAERLTLAVEEFGPSNPEQPAIGGLHNHQEDRRRRLAEAVRQVRQALGPEALLRVFEADPDARVPERRALLVPYPER